MDRFDPDSVDLPHDLVPYRRLRRPERDVPTFTERSNWQWVRHFLAYFLDDIGNVDYAFTQLMANPPESHPEGMAGRLRDLALMENPDRLDTWAQLVLERLFPVSLDSPEHWSYSSPKLSLCNPLVQYVGQPSSHVLKTGYKPATLSNIFDATNGAQTREQWVAHDPSHALTTSADPALLTEYTNKNRIRFKTLNKVAINLDRHGRLHRELCCPSGQLPEAKIGEIGADGRPPLPALLVMLWEMEALVPFVSDVHRVKGVLRRSTVNQNYLTDYENVILSEVHFHAARRQIERAEPLYGLYARYAPLTRYYTPMPYEVADKLGMVKPLNVAVHWREREISDVLPESIKLQQNNLLLSNRQLHELTVRYGMPIGRNRLGDYVNKPDEINLTLQEVATLADLFGLSIVDWLYGLYLDAVFYQRPENSCDE